MDTLCIQIQPLTAFGGPIKGDTLFGQLCWSVLHCYGEERLRELLRGYTENNPFLVCSDAFPKGYIPRPALPLHLFNKLEDEDRKRIKRRHWLPLDKIVEPLDDWLSHSLTEQEVLGSVAGETGSLSMLKAQPHNSIHRVLNTTHGGDFAPYTMPQHWFAEGLMLNLWILFDPARISMSEIEKLLGDIGSTGFGRDASIGLGKFGLDIVEIAELPRQIHANAYVTLAPSAPQGLGLNPDRCYYDLFTRFGRHGDRAVLSGRPFKNPVLLANTGAVLYSSPPHETAYIGQGLGGDGKLSNAIAETVHQGYAPGIGVHLREVTS